MVSLIKLTNGTEIVGTILKEDEHNYKVNNPLQINYYYTKANNITPSVALQRYMPFSANEDINFKKEHVAAVTEPIKGMNEYYTSVLNNIKVNVDTGIVADLVDASESMAYNAEHDQEMYLAILERMAQKKPLN